jgi:hypothetical protein
VQPSNIEISPATCGTHRVRATHSESTVMAIGQPTSLSWSIQSRTFGMDQGPLDHRWRGCGGRARQPR